MGYLLPEYLVVENACSSVVTLHEWLILTVGSAYAGSIHQFLPSILLKACTPSVLETHVDMHT